MRGASIVLATVLAAPSARAATSRLLVATPDPALGSALRAAFEPRGVEVLAAERPLLRTTDLPAVDTAPVVWLCDDGGSDALCVRRDGQTRVVRQVAMAKPLSAADAAALTLSVEVALLHPEPAQVAAPAPVAAPDAAAPFVLTLAVMGGTGSTPTARGGRFGADVVYAPARFGRWLGFGLGVMASSSESHEDQLGRPGDPRPPASHDDLAWRLFVRKPISLGRLWLNLDAGPSLHLVTIEQLDRSRTAALTADGAIGAVIPLGSFFVGARLGTSLLVVGGDARLAGSPRWGSEVLLHVGVGFR